jgi:hypothetical protein
MSFPVRIKRRQNKDLKRNYRYYTLGREVTKEMFNLKWQNNKPVFLQFGLGRH